MFTSFLAPFTQYLALTTGTCGKPTFIGLVPWYQYLTVTDDPTSGCTVEFPDASTSVLGSHSPFLLIALAIVDDLIRIAALVAVGYVIYGGIKYETSNGDPNATKNAQQTIINALVGLVLAILAASIVAYIGGQLGG